MKVQALPLTELSAKVGSIDLFVCCASYEARSLDVSNALNTQQVARAIVAENVNHAASHGRNAGSLLSRFEGRVTHALTSTEDPILTADALQQALRQHPDAERIVVDISTFTHEALLILFRLLANEDRRAEYLYSVAAEYSVGDPPGRKWLSRGIREVRSILGYPGGMVPSRKVHLVILTGFERERAAELVRHYEPSLVSLGVSASSEDAEHEAFASVKAFFPTAKEFTFDCFDPLGAADAIHSRIEATPDFNVVVAPMNTKLSTLGAGLLACASDRVQLCYAQAVFYNHLRYSRSSGGCYWLADVPDPTRDEDMARRWRADQKELAGA